MCLLDTGGQTDRQKITFYLIFSPPFLFSDGGIQKYKTRIHAVYDY